MKMSGQLHALSALPPRNYIKPQICLRILKEECWSVWEHVTGTDQTWVDKTVLVGKAQDRMKTRMPRMRWLWMWRMIYELKVNRWRQKANNEEEWASVVK
jgi:hypothetical protein